MDYCSRRSVLKGAGVAFTCLTCTATESTTGTASAQTQASQPWETLNVPNHPFSIRHYPGYQADAKRVREWAKYAYEKVQAVYSHALDPHITFDVYPGDDYDQSHDTMTYFERRPHVELVAPSDYNGSHTSSLNAYFRHGIVHEYTHAAQNNHMDFHTHANWIMEGFAEAVAVYHTDNEIYQQYHVNHSRAKETREDIQRGYGHLLGINEYVYRGSMHLLQFMIKHYGGQAVGEIYEQDAQNILEAIEKRLDITPLDLELEWLKYAQTAFGGDYTSDIERLGGRVDAIFSITPARPDHQDYLLVDDVQYTRQDFVLVATHNGTQIGVSETHEAGTHLTDARIPLDQNLNSPTPVTIGIHHADSNGPEEHATAYGDPLAQDTLYTTTPVSVGFSTPPTGGDTEVRVHAAADADYAPDAKYHPYILDGDSTHTGDHVNDTMIRLFAGEELTDAAIQLNESKPSVPLSDGQQITVMTKNLENNTVASRFTYTIGDQDSYSPETTPSTTSTTAKTETIDPSTEATQAAQSTGSDDLASATTTNGGKKTNDSTTTRDAAGFGVVSTLVGTTAAYITKRLRSSR